MIACKMQGSFLGFSLLDYLLRRPSHKKLLQPKQIHPGSSREQTYKYKTQQQPWAGGYLYLNIIFLFFSDYFGLGAPHGRIMLVINEGTSTKVIPLRACLWLVERHKMMLSFKHMKMNKRLNRYPKIKKITDGKKISIKENNIPRH